MSTRNGNRFGELATAVDTVHYETTFVPLSYRWESGMDLGSGLSVAQPVGIIPMIRDELDKEVAPFLEEISEEELEESIKIELDEHSRLGKTLGPRLPEIVTESLKAEVKRLNISSREAAIERAKERPASFHHARSLVDQVESAVQKQAATLNLFQGNWQKTALESEVTAMDTHGPVMGDYGEPVGASVGVPVGTPIEAIAGPFESPSFGAVVIGPPDLPIGEPVESPSDGDTPIGEPIELPPPPLFRTLPSLGYIFLERLRVRPIGYTRERAPFYELCLTPGEVVTIKQRSFSKRAISLEDTIEESKERDIEYASTFTTELQEEYTNTLQKTSNWGVSTSVSGRYGNPQSVVGVEGKIGGEYSAGTSETESKRIASRRARELSRKVESKQKTLHRTVINLSSEITLEDESVRVIRNGDARSKKLFFRRMMQVLHLSYERYGARVCWAPSVKDPGQDVRRYVAGVLPGEETSIRMFWDTQFPPPEVLTMDIAPKTLHTETIKRSGGGAGVSTDYTKSVTLPEGFQLADYEREILKGSGTPVADIKSAPEIGARGIVSFKIHIGLSVGESVEVRVKVNVEPTPEQQATYDNILKDWREKQVQANLGELSKTKAEKIRDLINAPWQQSELMRLIIRDYFGEVATTDYALMRRLETLFEWENLSYELHAPWWKPMVVEGLQSLRLSFDNASYATVYVPIRPNYEALAVAYLISIGALGPNVTLFPSMAKAIQAAVASFLKVVKPKFETNQQFTESDAKSISGPEDIILTGYDDDEEDDWANDFESEPPFEVLDRFVVTIPTDGVDIEEAPATYELQSVIRDADERIAKAEASLKEAIVERIGTASPGIQVSVNWNGKE